MGICWVTIIIIIFIFIFIIIITVIIIMKALPGTYLELLSAVSHPTPTSSPETSDVRLKKQVLIIIILSPLIMFLPQLIMIIAIAADDADDTLKD